ncbi:hypothetical protein [Fluviibacter phosphoraccumulans]|uniref:hypothetical protein n=1 Tax=Fluviibacter phosphoraccumulans TaxID=1751046 RepID=UPI0013B08B36|nr:hypothetical protein [Fluviibacter phosphoraccumulans]BCA65796.1 hypothetical protein SHINM1_013980 [Fluviibacter phosphoraccumulans]
MTPLAPTSGNKLVSGASVSSNLGGQTSKEESKSVKRDSVITNPNLNHQTENFSEKPQREPSTFPGKIVDPGLKVNGEPKAQILKTDKN